LIKKLSIEDYDEIIELWQEAGLSFREKGRDHRDAIQKQLESDNVLFLGKIQDERIVGVVLVSHDQRKGWINRIAVHPLKRRQGIGKELLNATEEYLKNEKGIEIFGALIFADNFESIQLFENSNYEKWEEVQYFSKRIRSDS
jgi:ribosomal protein S18 acetylase RimI-like enzyme